MSLKVFRAHVHYHYICLAEDTEQAKEFHKEAFRDLGTSNKDFIFFPVESIEDVSKTYLLSGYMPEDYVYHKFHPENVKLKEVFSFIEKKNKEGDVKC
jgi:hypothetical protein